MDSPNADFDTRSVPLADRLVRGVVAVTWCYPFSLVMGFYATWLAAWMVLGHPPRPSIDDPMQISGWVDVPYVVTEILLVGFPIAVIGGVAATFRHARVRHLSRPASLGWALLLAEIWCGVILVFRFDPMHVVNWLLD